MNNITFIIGNDNAGKFSLIRHLTGASRSAYRMIRTIDDNIIGIYAYMTSIQEMKYALSPVELENCLKLLDSVNPELFLIPLRATTIPKRNSSLPVAQEYIDYFSSASWNIKSIFILDPAFAVTGIPVDRLHRLPHVLTAQKTSNSIASQARSILNWM